MRRLLTIGAALGAVTVLLGSLYATYRYAVNNVKLRTAYELAAGEKSPTRPGRCNYATPRFCITKYR